VAQKSCIPGYDEALAREREIRESAFVSDKARIFNIEVWQITPFLLARLFRMKTPFFGHGEHSLHETLRFLWSVSTKFSQSIEDRETFIQEASLCIAAEGLENVIAEIDQFIDDAFLDAPVGGVDSVPYICSVAWMIYRMKCEPHRLTEEQAGNTPIARIYQYIKCAQFEKGDILYNAISDPVKATWLADLRDGKFNLN